MNLFPGKVFPQTKHSRPRLARCKLSMCELWQTANSQRGGAIALVILFLPVAVLSIGIVADLGVLFSARRLVQAACDLGALAGCQELDWDLLAKGTVSIDENRGRAKAIEYVEKNLESMESMFQEVNLRATVSNMPNCEPAVTVQADVVVHTYFLRWVPGLGNGITITIISESSVVERTKW
ncbi:MAG TPA: hypothetical protein GX529_02565 [Firmicutes bacterium]|nr:hypothetical protein [Candidatus Fermentithermobacillaceae bacterium]